MSGFEVDSMRLGGGLVSPPPFSYPGGQLPSVSPSATSNQGLIVLRATVIGSLPAAGFYKVATDYGQRTARYGFNRGTVNASQTFSAGDIVWVAVDAAGTQGAGTILCGAGDTVSFKPLLASIRSVYPQVAGIQYKKGEKTDIPLGLAARLATTAFIPNSGAPYRDAAGGEWSAVNRFGGGVSVEQFRARLAGGPFAALEFDSDTEAARLVSRDFTRMSWSRESQELRMASMLVEVDRGVFLPVDALLGNRPQLFSLSGYPFGGEQKTLTYRHKDNLPEDVKADEVDNVGQLALIHEYRGLDGTFSLTAAGSITLQKWFGFPVPVERRKKTEQVEGTVKDFPALAPIEPTEDGTYKKTLIPTAKVAGRQVATASDWAKAGKRRFSLSTSGDALCQAVGIKGWVKGLIDWQLKGGVGELRDQYDYRNRPSHMYDFSDYTPELVDQLPDTYVPLSPSGWSIPRSVVVNVGPYGNTKRLYFGRAIISITEDGGIVLEEAGGARLVMSGGSAQLEVPKDFSTVVGRHRMTFVGGNDASNVNGGSETTVAGQLQVSANGPMTLQGGLDGFSATTIYGGGRASQCMKNGAVAEGAPAGLAGGGVRILSAGVASVTGGDVYIVASSKFNGTTATATDPGVWGGSVYVLAGENAHVITGYGKNGTAVPDNQATYSFAEALYIKRGAAYAAVGAQSYLPNLVCRTVAGESLYQTAGTVALQSVSQRADVFSGTLAKATTNYLATHGGGVVAVGAKAAFYGTSQDTISIFKPTWVEARRDMLNLLFPVALELTPNQANSTVGQGGQKETETSGEEEKPDPVPTSLLLAPTFHPMADRVFPAVEAAKTVSVSRLDGDLEMSTTAGKVSSLPVSA